MKRKAKKKLPVFEVLKNVAPKWPLWVRPGLIPRKWMTKEQVERYR